MKNKKQSIRQTASPLTSYADVVQQVTDAQTQINGCNDPATFQSIQQSFPTMCAAIIAFERSNTASPVLTPTQVELIEFYGGMLKSACRTLTSMSDLSWATFKGNLTTWVTSLTGQLPNTKAA